MSEDNMNSNPDNNEITNNKDFLEKEDIVSNIKQEDSEEKEMLPPEDKGSDKEKELNVTNIFSIGLIFLILIVIIILIFSSAFKKKKIKEKELATIGNKSIVELDLETPTNINSEENKSNKSEDTEEDLPEYLSIENNDKNEKEETPPNKAPPEIISVGSSGNNKGSERPDTRNSKSTRTINGLVQNEKQTSSSNNINNQSRNNSKYNLSTSSQRVNPYTEEYKAEELARLRQAYSSNNNSNNNSYLDSQQFYENNMGNGGSGQFLSEYSIWDGTIIPAALETAINTDNPGVVIARVTENIYSSYDASYLLIPEGSLLYATYNSSVSYGQNRIQVAWNLLIRPDGYRVQLGNMNGVDSQGASGYKANVSNHPFETLKALGLVALYSVIQTEITNDIKSEQNEYIKNSITDVYAQASKIGNKMVDKALNIKPRLTIPSGKEIKIITNIPLTLPPMEVNNPTQKYIRH